MSGLTKATGFPTVNSVLALADIDSPYTYRDLANIGDITNSSSRGVQDVSAHGVSARRKVGVILDEGSYSFTLFFIAAAGVEATHTEAADGLYSIYKRNDLRSYALFLRDGATANTGTARYFNAYITKFAEGLPVAGVHTATVEITIDGEVLTGTEEGGAASAVFAVNEDGSVPDDVATVIWSGLTSDEWADITSTIWSEVTE